VLRSPPLPPLEPDGDRTDPALVRRRADLRAWRVWRVVRHRDGLRLRSPVYEDEWSPGEPLAAVCRAERSHRAPADGCSCGFYGLSAPDRLGRYLVGRDDPSVVVCRVVGEVALWGLVLEGESGWRAEYAYPSRIIAKPAQLDELAAGLAAYGVPIRRRST
jgi:hypothetical protein